jgi:hypothetical protein
MLLNTKINKHWLNNAQASGVDLFALSTIYFDLHLVDQVGLVLINPDREIPAPCVCLEYAEPARFSRTAKHFFDNLNGVRYRQWGGVQIRRQSPGYIGCLLPGGLTLTRTGLSPASRR